MNFYTKLHRSLLSLTCLLFCALPLWSRHIIGGDLSYTYLGETPGGEKQYRFTMHVYRDCLSGGAGFDNPAELAIYRGSWGQSVLYSSFSIITQAIEQLDNLSNCSMAPLNICYEQATYIFERSLPLAPGESYFIVYQRCCLQNTLLNIVNPDERGVTILVELTTEAMALNNSSPTLPAYPVEALCVHEPMTVLQAAVDTEQDQLRYSFGAPFSGGGPILNPPGLYTCDGVLPTPPCAPPYAALNYVEPEYSPQIPMAGDPVIQLDSISGIITGTPNRIGQYMVGLICWEYRDSTLLSTTRRNIVFNVYDPDMTPVEEHGSAGGVFRLQPNPAGDWVSWPAAFEIREVQLFDLLGRRLKTLQGNDLTGLDTQGLKPGYYRLVAMSRDGVFWTCSLLIAR